MRLCGLKSKTEPRGGNRGHLPNARPPHAPRPWAAKPSGLRSYGNHFSGRQGSAAVGRKGEDWWTSGEADGGRRDRDGDRPHVRLTRLHFGPSPADRPPSRHSCRRGDLLGCANNRSYTFPVERPSRGACCCVRGWWIPILDRLVRTLSGMRIRSHPAIFLRCRDESTRRKRTADEVKPPKGFEPLTYGFLAGLQDRRSRQLSYGGAGPG